MDTVIVTVYSPFTAIVRDGDSSTGPVCVILDGAPWVITRDAATDFVH